MKKIFALTVIDVIMICSPIVILFFVLVVAEIEPSEIWKKPEWSFITIVLFVESFRDYLKAWKHKGDHEDYIGAQLAVLALCLVIISLVLVIDFRHSLGLLKADKTGMVYNAKFFLFGCCLIFFAITKWRKYSILGHDDDSLPIIVHTAEQNQGQSQ